MNYYDVVVPPGRVVVSVLIDGQPAPLVSEMSGAGIHGTMNRYACNGPPQQVLIVYGDQQTPRWPRGPLGPI